MCHSHNCSSAKLLRRSLSHCADYLFANVLLCLGVVPSEPRGTTLLWLLRFTTSLPYVFGALAKLTSYDWMVRFQPCGRWCERELQATAKVLLPAHWISSVHYVPRCAAVLSLGGVLIDVGVVPLLASGHRQTGFALAAAFHLANATLFHIGGRSPMGPHVYSGVVPDKTLVCTGACSLCGIPTHVRRCSCSTA